MCPRSGLGTMIACEQVADIAQHGVVRAFGQFGVLRRGEVALEVVEQPVDDLALPLVQAVPVDPLPQRRLVEAHAELPARARRSRAFALSRALVYAGLRPVPCTWWLHPGFSTDILDGAIERRRRTREQLRTTTRESLVQALEAARVPVDEAIIFGSIERPGHFDAASDIDLVGPLAARDYFTLKSHLEHSLGREIDIVDLHRCHFAAPRLPFRYLTSGSIDEVERPQQVELIRRHQEVNQRSDGDAVVLTARRSGQGLL